MKTIKDVPDIIILNKQSIDNNSITKKSSKEVIDSIPLTLYSCRAKRKI